MTLLLRKSMTVGSMVPGWVVVDHRGRDDGVESLREIRP